MSDNEWYTQPKYIEAARKVLGSIDLDPASCAEANQIVGADKYYTEQDNGLIQPWYGKVWLNPPYGKVNNKSLILLFVRKLVHAYATQAIEQAILLCDCDPDAEWFQPLWDYPICFANHKVYFYRPSMHHLLPQLYSKHGHMFGTIFVYFGPNEDRFIEHFSKFGTIARRVSAPPKPTTQNLQLWEEGVV
jgi:ParB family chromosome partitioning protein